MQFTIPVYFHIDDLLNDQIKGVKQGYGRFRSTQTNLLEVIGECIFIDF